MNFVQFFKRCPPVPVLVLGVEITQETRFIIFVNLLWPRHDACQGLNTGWEGTQQPSAEQLHTSASNGGLQRYHNHGARRLLGPSPG